MSSSGKSERPRVSDTKMTSAVRIAERLWRRVRDSVGPGPAGRRTRVADRKSLGHFLQSRASMVAQSSLYGYLRTRAGTRFPELFSHEEFSKSIDIAKWNLWLACLSDLAAYAGGLLAHRVLGRDPEIRTVIVGTVEALLAATGIPQGAGGDFPALAERLRARLAACDFSAIRDDETAFVESPTALVHWAPVLEDLKRLDEEIVRNSVRFRWQEVRRDLRAHLDAPALLESSRAAATDS